MADELPKLADINRQLAASDARIRAFVDRLSDRAGQLVAAAGQRNWPELNRLSKSLAYRAEQHGLCDLAEAARAVSGALGLPDGPTEVYRRVAAFVSQCGRVRRGQTRQNASQPGLQAQMPAFGTVPSGGGGGTGASDRLA